MKVSTKECGEFVNPFIQLIFILNYPPSTEQKTKQMLIFVSSLHQANICSQIPHQIYNWRENASNAEDGRKKVRVSS